MIALGAMALCQELFTIRRIEEICAVQSSRRQYFNRLEVDTMNVRLIRINPGTGLALALAACAHHEPTALPTAAQSPPAQAGPVSVAEVAGEAVSFNSVDDYKRLAALHIKRYNGEHTFSGDLPRMLPAVVVLGITVNEEGTITDVLVQRPPAKDDGESEIALASMRRTMLLPKPYNLAVGRRRTLVYSETFLFNADMRFQLRTLAPIQTHED